MDKRFRGLLAASAITAALSLSSVGAGVAHAAPPPPGSSSPGTDGLVAQAAAAGSAVLVRTTTLGTGTPSSSGAQPLPSTVPASDMPKTPDVGNDSSAQAPVSSSKSHPHARAQKSGIPYPTVAGSAVTGPTGGLTSVPGLNGYDQGATHPVGPGQPGVDVEPSDQGLCASPTSTVELNNEVIEVFSGSGLHPVTVAPLESLFGTPEIFGAGANNPTDSVQGDPRCAYDSSTGHWYASQLWLDLNDATPQGWAGTWLAVSKTSDPTGSWSVYFVPDLSNQTNTATCNNDSATNPNANPCFGDQPLLGVDGSTVQLSTNEYSINGNFPNGQANLFFLSKGALDRSVKSVPVYWNAVGATVATPGVGPWYSLTPAQAPAGTYSSQFGGTSYALSSLDFVGSGDQRIAEWAYTNTAAVDHAGQTIGIYELTLTSGEYATPPLAAQKAGSTPLGDSWNAINGAKSNKPLPEGPVQTNDDRMATAAFDPSNGALVGALNTGVYQLQPAGSSRLLAGIAYFAVTPALGSSGLEASSVATGYISPSGANAFYPGAAITPAGRGVIDYGMSGTGYYPSTAYSTVAAGDSVGPGVHLAAAGAGPADGFTEYQGIGTSSYRPRWGDYSTAVVTGSTVEFAAEMVNQSCTDAQFKADFTCGSTRDLFINWGTSVNVVTP
jgi:hypothetical protein